MMNVENRADEPVIVMTRTFDAPRDVVWEAFTDPKHVARWYGGHGFENPVCEMDVRPGGIWRHVMRTPDGAEYPMEYVFLEVEEPSRLSWKANVKSGAPEPGHESPVMTVVLEEAGKKTKWTLISRFSSMAARERAMQIGFTQVLSQGTEKFAALVEQLVRTRRTH